MTTHNEKKEKQGWTECFKHIENRAHFGSIITGFFSIITGIAMLFIAGQTYLLNEQTVEIQKRSVELQEKSAEIQKRSAELQKRSAELQEKSLELQEKSLELQQKEDNRSETKITQELQEKSDKKFTEMLSGLSASYSEYLDDQTRFDNNEKGQNIYRKEYEEKKEKLSSLKNKHKTKATTWENNEIQSLSGAVWEAFKKFNTFKGEHSRLKNQLESSKKQLLQEMDILWKVFCDKEVNSVTLRNNENSVAFSLCSSGSIAEMYTASIKTKTQVKEKNFWALCEEWLWTHNDFNAALNKKFKDKNLFFGCQ